MTAAIDILLVDDQARNLDALEAILAQPEYRLLRALDADTALRLLLEHEVAAIVLDIQMPSVSGLELARMIKTTKRFRETPIVFLTAFQVDDRQLAEGYGVGAVDYLTKPIHPQILRQKIAVFAELFRRTRALAELNATLEQRVKERTEELSRSEAELRRAAEQKDEFLAVLAHELRNPLAPLRMGLDLVMAERAYTSSVARTLGTMDRQLRHMVRLIDDLLDISRLSRGALELRTEPVDLGALILDTVEAYRPLLEAKSQNLELSLGAGVERSVDSTRIAQLLGNLLHNANKFTTEGGNIRVELAEMDDVAVLSVLDDGIGLPPGSEEQAFQMFARIARADHAAQPGLGIGLALARRLATMHGGSLVAERRQEGAGTAFRLKLPADPATQCSQPTFPPVSSARSNASRRVLVIEDNDDVASTLADWLQAKGHDVEVATDGPGGIAKAAEMHPEIILCDLGLPGLSGLEVCRRLRTLPTAERPVIVALTGWGRQADREQTRASGFDHHLVKPIDPGALLELLEEIPSRVG
ncbi:MAG TPA: response regulator [Polyangiaceae bacterium]|nr:response regulator [Polyangiaceae bacterium]